MNDKAFEMLDKKVDGIAIDLKELVKSQNRLITAVNNNTVETQAVKKDQVHLEEQQYSVEKLIKHYKPSWQSYKKVQKKAEAVTTAVIVAIAVLIAGSAYTFITSKEIPPPAPEAKKVQLVKE